MTERIRVRRPWLAVLTPSVAALFSTVLVWATGHDPGTAALASAATPGPASSAPTSEPSVTPTQDAAAGVAGQIATQEAELRRLAAEVRALRSALPGSAHATRTTPAPPPSSAARRPQGSTPAPTHRPAPVHTPSTHPVPDAPGPEASGPDAIGPAVGPPPPVPTPHVTTRSS